MTTIPEPIVTLIPPQDWVTLEQGDAFVDRTVINITASGTTQLPAPTATLTSVYVNSTGAVTVEMPLAAQLTAGQSWELIDTSGNASTYNITANGNGSLIAGVASKAISTNYGSLTLEWNGTAFSVVT